VKRLLLFVAVAGIARSQSDFASLTGLVTDAGQGRIRGAKVSTRHTDTEAKFETVTNESGFYGLTSLRPGKYTLTVEAAGFKTEIISGIELGIQEKATVDLTLEVGQLTEQVTVESTTPLLNAMDSSLGQVVDNRSIIQMPLNGRNYLQLAVLAAGIAPVSKNRWADNTSAFAANGLRYTMNTYALDGVDNTSQMLGLISGGTELVRPSIDAIQEFKIQTSNYSAEFGRGAGAVINATTKSGTNNYHGTAYEFHRDASLDAKNFFDPQNLKIPPFVQKPVWRHIGRTSFQKPDFLLYKLGRLAPTERIDLPFDSANVCAAGWRVRDRANVRSCQPARESEWKWVHQGSLSGQSDPAEPMGPGSSPPN
jgi:hypothetical protein